ncbi:MAG: hypothetical protein OEV64_06100 [Desulfobulbaceae bacterium]|nr:hypothetical protein [Desulfobulbaceae bacterium]
MFPEDSVQSLCDVWWEKDNDKKLKKGSLIYAFIPHVDQLPVTLIPKGRKNAEEHDKAILNITELRINDRRPKEALPVAALSLNEGELWTAYRAKKRPCLVLATEQPKVENALRRGMPNKHTAPTIIVAPYYGADKDGRRAGYNQELVSMIRHAGYPQFFLDKLPIGGPKESILRFDHIQPVGSHYYTYEHTGYSLSDEAVESILNDWIQWVLYGGLPEGSIILDYRADMISTFYS